MKKFSAILALTAGLSISAFAANIDGFVVDKGCSGQKGMWTNTACTTKCLKGGDVAVFVTPDGKVYTVDQAKVKGVIGKATISGTINGDSIDITSIKASAM